MPTNTHKITAAILAGGQGTRLGGVDKGLIPLQKIPLVQHVINRIEPQVENIIISANQNLEIYADFGFAVFEDDLSDFAGPLAGILKALQQSQSDWLLTVPADSPFIAADLAQRLSRHVQDNKIIIAHDGERLQPTFALIHKSMESSLTDFLQQGERKTRVWMLQQPHTIVDFSDQADTFININTEDDLKKAEKHFNKFMR
jgi:molybdenum cofactor guanylyltransferase